MGVTQEPHAERLHADYSQMRGKGRRGRSALQERKLNKFKPDSTTGIQEPLTTLSRHREMSYSTYAISIIAFTMHLFNRTPSFELVCLSKNPTLNQKQE